jgi:hypothetical protein
MPYKTEDYVVIKDGKVALIVDTSQGKEGVENTIKQENLEGATYEKIPTINGICPGDDIRKYDKNWKMRPLQELVNEGLHKLKKAEPGEIYIPQIPEGTVVEKVVDNELRYKTHYDFVKEGIVELGYDEYIDEESQEVEQGDDAKLLEFGRITPQEYTDRLEAGVRRKRDELLAMEVDPIVTNPLRWGSLSEEHQGKIMSYRQELLDITAQEGFPEDVKWPEL